MLTKSEQKLVMFLYELGEMEKLSINSNMKFLEKLLKNQYGIFCKYRGKEINILAPPKFLKLKRDVPFIFSNPIYFSIPKKFLEKIGFLHRSKLSQAIIDLEKSGFLIRHRNFKKFSLNTDEKRWKLKHFLKVMHTQNPFEEKRLDESLYLLRSMGFLNVPNQTFLYLTEDGRKLAVLLKKTEKKAMIDDYLKQLPNGFLFDVLVARFFLLLLDRLKAYS